MKLILVAITAGSAIMMGCNAVADKATALPTAIPAETPIRKPMTKRSNHLPKAVVYKTNRPVDNHPAVRVKDLGNELVYYPAPSDISEESRPLRLTGNWLLDRQGSIGDGTRFMKYTFDEYAALPAAPKAQDILNSLLEDVHVTEIHTLDITLQEAIADTSAVNAMLRIRPTITNPIPIQ